MTPEEESLMEKALITTYSLRGISIEDDSIEVKEIPVMQDLQNGLDTMDGARSLVSRMEKYTSGIFAGIFSKRTNVDLKE